MDDSFNKYSKNEKIKRMKIDQDYLENEIRKKQYLQLQRQKEKSRKYLFAFTISLFAILPVLTTALYKNYFSNSIIILVMSIVTITIMITAFLYLQNSKNRYNEYILEDDNLKDLFIVKNKNKELEEQNKLLQKQIYEIYELLQRKSSQNLFSDSEKKKIISNIQNKLETEGLNEYQEYLTARIEEKIKLSSFDDVFSRMKIRIQEEIQSSGRRGNLNLLLGIFTTILGLMILGYTVFNTYNISELTRFSSYFISRLSLVIFIELFSYFFLRLYKQCLHEIKYYQNELTNIENKHLGAKLAVSTKNEKLHKAVINSLVSTERNFVLEKGQTTVEIEKQKLDNKDISKIYKAFDIIKNRIKN